MANNRPIDRTKKSNIKCEHCKYWDKGNYIGNTAKCKCFILNENKNYWNRCKAFEWKADVKEVR